MCTDVATGVTRAVFSPCGVYGSSVKLYVVGDYREDTVTLLELQELQSLIDYKFFKKRATVKNTHTHRIHTHPSRGELCRNLISLQDS